MKKKIVIELNEEQVGIILEMIDCFTSEDTPDFFYDDESKSVYSWNGEGKTKTSLQDHLDKFLNHDKLDF